jgi:uncharacterized membrane protein YphA (DoxX/SURF4 family)
MSASQWRPVVIVALRLVITLLFVPAILVKFRNPGAWSQLFMTWGYPSWGPVVISTIEIIGLAALWIPAVAQTASAALMVTTAGATATWLIHGPRSTAAYPGTILILVASLAWLQQARVKRDSHVEHLEPLSK